MVGDINEKVRVGVRWRESDPEGFTGDRCVEVLAIVRIPRVDENTSSFVRVGAFGAAAVTNYSVSASHLVPWDRDV